jgi:hypothetical protein
MFNSMSKRLPLVLALFFGWLVKPTEVELVGPAFPCENMGHP